MTCRKLPNIKDYILPVPTNLLKQTLADFFPISKHHRSLVDKLYLSTGHHLVYFPSPSKLSDLLPDGTDPLHSPGPPFHRRMWAGGSVVFLQPPRLSSKAFILSERIIDVQVKGQDGDEKVFVTIERNIKPRDSKDELKENIKSHVLETRNIVFMRDKSQQSSTDVKTPSKVLKPTQIADVVHTMVPTPSLLFRFSALTYNAHAIHLDKKYCQEIEGHRNLLVHGPLSLVLMLETLKHHLLELNYLRDDNVSERISFIEYRNLAPLYAEEEMKICLRRKEDGTQTGSFDVWVEGKDGGYAVKGLVKTEKHASKDTDMQGTPLAEQSDAPSKDVLDEDTLSQNDDPSIAKTNSGDHS